MPKRILIADDVENTRKAIQRTLELAGYEVISASDGDEALQMAIEQKPDLAVFDMTMPNLHGHEVCRKLRERDDELARLPVILVTGVDEFLGGALAESAGVQKYLTKPIDPKELTGAMEELLGETGNQGSEQSVISNATFGT